VILNLESEVVGRWCGALLGHLIFRCECLSSVRASSRIGAISHQPLFTRYYTRWPEP